MNQNIIVTTKDEAIKPKPNISRELLPVRLGVGIFLGLVSLLAFYYGAFYLIYDFTSLIAAVVLGTISFSLLSPWKRVNYCLGGLIFLTIGILLIATQPVNPSTNNLTPKLNLIQLKQNIDALENQGMAIPDVQNYVNLYSKATDGSYVLKSARPSQNNTGLLMWAIASLLLGFYLFFQTFGINLIEKTKKLIREISQANATRIILKSLLWIVVIFVALLIIFGLFSLIAGLSATTIIIILLILIWFK